MPRLSLGAEEPKNERTKKKSSESVEKDSESNNTNERWRKSFYVFIL